MSFYNNYVRLCAEHKETPSGAAVAIGLSNAAATGWKKGKIPSDLNLAKLAEHFQCSVDDLIWNRAAFSSNLIKIMADNGKTIASFSAELHIPKDRVALWLNRGATPNRDELIAIAEQYGYDVSSLDQTLIDTKIPAMSEHDGPSIDGIKRWIASAGREELLELISAATDRLKELRS